jgi:hypothetical protein
MKRYHHRLSSTALLAWSILLAILSVTLVRSAHAAIGDVCDNGSQCGPFPCVDGYCCDRSCDAPCAVCNGAARGWPQSINGVCAFAPRGAAPRQGSNCNLSLCDGAGETCSAGCSDDTTCTASAWCSTEAVALETCIPRRPVGKPCDDVCSNGQCHACASELCVDGVCCDSECPGSCSACTQSLKGHGEDGICEVAIGGGSGRGLCEAEEQHSCGRKGVCDGAGQCALYEAGVPCGDPICVCAPPDCHSAAASTFACDGIGGCAPHPVVCLMGCDVDASRCATIGAATGGDGATCDGAICDGGDETSDAAGGSSDADTDVSEAASLDQGSVDTAHCSGDGSAVVRGNETFSCQPYLCANGQCLSVCTSKDDCSAGNVCNLDLRCGPFDPRQLPPSQNTACALSIERPRETHWTTQLAMILAAALVGLRRSKRSNREQAHR